MFTRTLSLSPYRELVCSVAIDFGTNSVGADGTLLWSKGSIRPGVVKYTLQMAISKCASQDRMVWPHSRSDHFEVRKEYRFVHC